MGDILEQISEKIVSAGEYRETLDAAYAEIERLRKQVEIALSALKHVRDISDSVGASRD